MKASLVLAVVLLARVASSQTFGAWTARAEREERAQDTVAAERSYSKALSSWTRTDGRRARARAYHRRGLLRLGRAQSSLAIDDFYRAVKDDLGFAQAYADRARAYASMGERDFAREDHQRACDLGLKESCFQARELAPPPSREELRRQFQGCLRTLEACSSEEASIGGCVERTAACGKQVSRDCCPPACLRAFRRRLDAGSSEAQAYREVFTAGAACAGTHETP